jgi:hypothetical protein
VNSVQTVIAALLILVCGSGHAAFDPRIDSLATSITLPTGRQFVMSGVSGIITLSASEQTFTFSSFGSGALKAVDMATTGCKYHIHIRGNVAGSALAVNTLLLKLKTGSTVMAAGSAVTVPTSLATSYFEVNAYVMVDTPGSSGSVSTVGFGQGVWNGVATPVFAPARTSATINTTVDQSLSLTATGGVGLLGYGSVQIDEAEMDRVY